MHGIASGNAFSTLMLLVGQQEWYLEADLSVQAVSPQVT